MKPILQPTDDGSLTLRLDEMDETYHSTNGALTEAQYVYIKNGFERTTKEHLNILEIGFGTGLNTLVTADAFLKQDHIKSVHYHTLEKYPLETEIINQLNYGQRLSPPREAIYSSIHNADWEKKVEILNGFTLHKQKIDLLTESLSGCFDLVYYDAFAPSKQEEMWQKDVIQKVADVMKQGALLSTYCAQGEAKRAFRACGLKIRRLPGPPGKWHMLIGVKE
jgi:tRNA U34 5-methylaminomethyl-2-thiouridine-forming methyltransferase MnmC